jgi:hypothetical protein
VAVNADEREEISASVAAHAELGPRYDSAVAEGLVERIGEEIDRRVDARLRELDRRGGPSQPSRLSEPTARHQQATPPAYTAPAVPAQAPVASTPPPPPQPPAPRGSGVTGMILGLGSMGLGVGATAAVVSHHVDAVAEVFIIVLIWLAIAAINIAHSQRR